MSRFVPSQTQALTYTIRHVASGGAETSIGTGVADPIVGGAGATFFTKTQRIALSEKIFLKGETLRLNILHTGGNSAHRVFYDPSGTFATTETPVYAHDSFILIPIKLDA